MEILMSRIEHDQKYYKRCDADIDCYGAMINILKAWRGIKQTDRSFMIIVHEYLNNSQTVTPNAKPREHDEDHPS